MAEPTIDIERVVREVLARLGAGASVDEAPEPAAESPPASKSTTLAACEDGALTVTSRVVTVAEVGDKLGAVRRLIVPPKAVITPSVRDELHRRNVTLVYGQPCAPAGSVRLRSVVTTLGSYDPGSLVAALHDEPVTVELRRHHCLVAATDELATELAKPDTVGVIVSDSPATAICLANRQCGVRAVWGVDPARLTSDLDSVGANLLVVDPQAAGPFRLKQMVTQFCRQGRTACPEPLRERLG
jgi:hypothetical protein